MSSSIEITPELLAGFLDEAPEYLDMLDVGLMEFESKAEAGALSLDSAEDQERMNTMFRAAHSLKGLAAAFGFEKIKELTHRMETLFDHVRMGKRSLTVESFEVLFGVFDRLKALIEELSEGSEGDVKIDDVLAALDEVLKSPAPPSPSQEDQVAGQSQDAAAQDDAAAERAESTPDATESGGVALKDNEIFADPELAAMFVETTGEAVDELNNGLLALEKNPSDAELLNTVFRCAHNIKGASGAAGLTGMNRLTHNMESVLDRLRSGGLELTDELMNALFQTVDRLRATVERLREGSVEDIPASETEGKFDQWLVPTKSASDLAQGTESSSDEQANGATCAGGDLPDPGFCYVNVRFPDSFDEAAIQAYLIFNKLSDIGHVHSTEPDIDSLAGDSVLTHVRYTVETDVEAEEIVRIIQGYSVEEVSVTSSESEADAAESSAKEAGVDQAAACAVASPAPSTAPSVAASNDNASRTVTTADPPPATKKPSSPPAAEASAPKTAPPPGTKAKAGGKSGQPPVKTVKTAETLRVDQERLDHLMNLGGELIINRARFVQIHGKFREVFEGKNLGYLVEDMTDRVSALSKHVEDLRTRGDDARETEDVASHVLHLTQSFQAVRTLVQQVHELRTSMFDFDEALHGLTRVSDAIQKGIMGTRMVPIGPLFGRFKRVVRDIAKSSGKKIELVLHGENTELDKRMIDELGDPLTHMVRNSVDHGIEMPEVRAAAGKPEVGTVKLKAYHRGNSICIEVSDDGAGVNLELVRAKVIEKELATSAQVEKMSDRELVQYIMKPGFSTAAVVTDLSGRGMGMDIVLSKIDKLNGTVECDSTSGEGTRVVIKLPLTLAILTSLVARIGRGIYAIPLETVAEIITIHRSDIQYIQRREVVRVRERIVPVAKFESIFTTQSEGLRTVTRDDDELTLVIVGFEQDKIGLVVDELLGQEDVVIKSIAENYRNVRGIAGASIRGDGTVSLILDINAMMEMASKIEQPATPPSPELAAAEC